MQNIATSWSIWDPLSFIIILNQDLKHWKQMETIINEVPYPRCYFVWLRKVFRAVVPEPQVVEQAKGVIDLLFRKEVLDLRVRCLQLLEAVVTAWLSNIRNV